MCVCVFGLFVVWKTSTVEMVNFMCQLGRDTGCLDIWSDDILGVWDEINTEGRLLSVTWEGRIKSVEGLERIKR